jgi:hypothetical protein
MASFIAFVLVPPSVPVTQRDIEEAVEQLITPYSRWLEVPEYRKYLNDLEINQVRWSHNIARDDLEQIVQKLKEKDDNVGIDEKGVYRLTTRNPQGIWDSWRIGGRWDGVIQGRSRSDGKLRDNLGPEHQQVRYNTCVASQLPKFLAIEELVTPDGIWHSWGVKRKPGVSSVDQLEQITTLVGLYPYYTTVCIECHF